MRFILIRSRGQWRFILKARNGKTLAHSEAYREKRKALQAIELIACKAIAAKVVQPR